MKGAAFDTRPSPILSPGSSQGQWTFGPQQPLLSRNAVGTAAECPGALDFLHLRVRETEHVAQDFLCVLAEQRRASDFGGRVRQLYRITDTYVLAPGRMVDLNQRARGEERPVL